MLRPLFFCGCLLAALHLYMPAYANAAAWDDWNGLQQAVRDGRLPPEPARQRLIALDRRLRQAIRQQKPSPARQFPVAGYGPSCIGGTAGSGYHPAGYDFYAGNRHGGHPAHDLFIRDANGDGLDDVTGRPALVVAFADGMVTGVNPAWQYPSPIRGGKYVWVFSPDTGRYCYYAHLARTLVRPGDWLRAGQAIGLLGRTGRNAWAQRSPTHLHFMCLAFDQGSMTPVNTFNELLSTPQGPKSAPQ